MAKLLKIGDFAKFCHTTVATLLHYEAMGLLVPARIGSNGYRYYEISQYNRYASIRMMVAAHFPLAHIKELLDGRSFQEVEKAIGDEADRLREEAREIRQSQKWLGALSRDVALAADACYGEPEIVELPEMSCVVFSGDLAAPTVDFERSETLYTALRDTLERLIDLSPEAGLSPYGHSARGPLGDGPIVYDSMFFLVAPSIARHFANVVPVPAARYAQLAFEGPWEDKRDIHAKLIAFVKSHGGDPSAVRLEYSLFRPFDARSGAGFDDYRGMLIMSL